MTRDEFDEAIKTWLAAKTTKPVYLIDVPTGVAVPHFIIYPIGSTRIITSLDGNSTDREWRYQVTSVGEDAKQASWLSSTVLYFLTAVGEHTMTIDGHAITMRWEDLLGNPHKSGDRLYVVDDTYCIRPGF